MKKSKSISLLVLLLFLGTQSCDYSKSNLSHSLGKTLELLVVTDNKEQWNSRMGTSIKDFFGQVFIGLPQAEPMFDIFYLPQEAFGDIYKPNHLIFIADINPKLKEPIVETRRDLWATPQRVVKISAPDVDSFLQIFDEQKEGIMDLYQQLERERILKFFKTSEAKKVKKVLNNNFKIDMVFPTGFTVAKRVEDNFIWIRKETNLNSQGIMIHTFDYTNANVFELESIIARRNALTKLHIPGPIDHSYMKVADEVVEVELSEINFKDMYAVESRGLWDVYNDFMGGSFLSYTFVDEARNRVITIDSYVYAPKEKKRIHMKEVEAILHSFEFVENNLEAKE